LHGHIFLSDQNSSITWHQDIRVGMLSWRVYHFRIRSWLTEDEINFLFQLFRHAGHILDIGMRNLGTPFGQDSSWTACQWGWAPFSPGWTAYQNCSHLFDVSVSVQNKDKAKGNLAWVTSSSSSYQRFLETLLSPQITFHVFSLQL